jgi:hypothetical protein
MAPERNEENSIPLLDVEAQDADTSLTDKEFSSTPVPVGPDARARAAARRNFLLWTAINMVC